MLAFVDQHRDRYGVESIGAVLPIAPSTYYAHKARAVNPERVPPRAKHDARLKLEIRRVWEENFQVYGVRKLWRQLGREDIDTARCTVARLMREMGLRVVGRGRRVKTIQGDMNRAPPLDRVHRQFKANRPNALWVSDLTYVATCQGFSYVAFVIDAYARRIVGWRVAPSLSTDLALDALEQALYARPRGRAEDLVHHSGRGVQYASVRYTQRLAEASIEPSVGRVGDS